MNHHAESTPSSTVAAGVVYLAVTHSAVAEPTNCTRTADEVVLPDRRPAGRYWRAVAAKPAGSGATVVVDRVAADGRDPVADPGDSPRSDVPARRGCWQAADTLFRPRQRDSIQLGVPTGGPSSRGGQVTREVIWIRAGSAQTTGGCPVEGWWAGRTARRHPLRAGQSGPGLLPRPV